MSIDYLLPRAPERLDLHRLVQGAHDLLEIHTRLPRSQVVKQHSLLHRRKRVTVDEGCACHVSTRRGCGPADALGLSETVQVACPTFTASACGIAPPPQRH